MNDGAADRRARRLLAAGAGAGIALAAFGIVRSGSAPTAAPDGAVALVNGAPISREALARYAGTAFPAAGRVELDAAERRRLLDRLVDEELLLQRGIRLGIPRHEPVARRAIVSAMLAAVSAEAELRAPDEPTLRGFYSEQPDRFRRPAELALDVAKVRVDGRSESAAYERSLELARRLRAGEEFAAVRERLADGQPAPLPEGVVPLARVREVLGPAVARAAARLEIGAVSEPLRGPDGYYVLVARARKLGVVIPFEDVLPEVLASYVREANERALRAYLQELREEAEIVVLDDELRDP